MILMPSSIGYGPSLQARAEKIISTFLASKGPYMGIYFSDLDTAFTTLGDEQSYIELLRQMQACQDSTTYFSRGDTQQANYYFQKYQTLAEKRDSIRNHYQPRPLGYFILHHFQFEGHPWTDSFVLDFSLKKIIKVKETIE